MQHLAFKRSDVAHGRIRSIDTSAAEAMEGVEAVFTGAQIAEFLAPMPIATPFPSPRPSRGRDRRRPLRAASRWRSSSPATATSRATPPTPSSSTYDPLPAVVDPELAMTGQPVVIHPDFPNNLAVALVPSGTGVSADGRRWTTPPIDTAFAAAEVVISQRMVNQRLVPNAMETRGVVAHYEPGKGTMTIWSSTQNPHILRSMIAAMTGLGQDQVRAIAPEVGGGFGAKINIYAEEYVAAAVSKRLGIPVKWMEDRSEAFVATTHGRDIIGYVDLAAKRDGTVLGLKLRLIADIGAYNMLLTAAIPTLTMMMANATYDIPAIRTTLTEVFTNKTPTDAYRGAGRPEATYFVERAMDMLARELKHGSGGGAPEELHPAGQVPVPDADGRRLRLRRLREGARPRAEERELGALEGRARRRAGRRDGSSASDWRCTSRSAASARRRRCRPAAGSTRRSPSSATAASAPRPAPRRTARATKRRSRRCSPTSSACRSSTSRFFTATPASSSRGSAPSAAARRRWAARPCTWPAAR